MMGTASRMFGTADLRVTGRCKVRKRKNARIRFRSAALFVQTRLVREQYHFASTIGEFHSMALSI